MSPVAAVAGNPCVPERRVATFHVTEHSEVLTVGIAGFGSAGSLLTRSIIDEAEDVGPHRPIELVGYHDGQAPGKGAAFRDDGIPLLSNNSVGQLREDKAVPGLAGRLESYPTRLAVGERFTEIFHEDLPRAQRAGVAIQVRAETAEDVRLMPYDAIALRGSKSGWKTFDAAAFCTGNGEPEPPYPLTGPLYVNHPFSAPLVESLAEAGQAARVGIIGTGLSSVDFFEALQFLGAHNPAQQIFALSQYRYARFPNVRLPASKFPEGFEAKYFTDEHFRDIAAHREVRVADIWEAARLECARRECARYGLSPEAILADQYETPTRQRLTEQIRACAGQAPDVAQKLALIRKTVPRHETLWEVGNGGVRRMLRRGRGTFMVIAVPMPQERATEIVQAMDSKAFTVVGDVRTMANYGGGYVARRADGSILQLDAVINAATLGKPSRKGINVLEQLVALGIGAPGARDGLGGVATDGRKLKVVTPQGKLRPNVFALGDPTRESGRIDVIDWSRQWPLTAGLEFIKEQARRAAHEIVQLALA